MELAKLTKPGDILLLFPNSQIGRLIVKATFGKVNHAAIVVNETTLFETDGDMGKAKFMPISKYDNRHLLIMRCSYLNNKEADLLKLCQRYNGTPYSYWDIITNGLFCWLRPQLREKVIAFLGTKRFMVCSELVARIVYQLTWRKEWADYEGMVPEDIRLLGRDDPINVKFCDISSHRNLPQ